MLPYDKYASYQNSKQRPHRQRYTLVIGLSENAMQADRNSWFVFFLHHHFSGWTRESQLHSPFNASLAALRPRFPYVSHMNTHVFAQEVSVCVCVCIMGNQHSTSNIYFVRGQTNGFGIAVGASS